ncbi:MAG: isopentenyl-diphosphate Delta-isomerase [Pararhodobacter sp.]
MANTIPCWIDGELRPMDKLEVHRAGLRHPAVSVFVLQRGQLLIQRRALGKYHTPGLWANTCCTHPHWGEAPLACAQRRLQEELGISGLALEPRGQVEYRAEVGNGMIEHELVDLFRAEAPDDLGLHPDPSEVMQTRLVEPGALLAEIEATPEVFTPWLRIYLREHGAQILAGRAA